MRSFVLALLIAAAPLAVGCGGDNGSNPADMAMPDLFVLSQCGHPGDVGNSLGVGRYCTRVSDCGKNGEMTNICSALGNGPMPTASDTYFCTVYPCTPDAGTTNECGDNATCVCGSSSGGGGCACTPNSCK